MRFAMEAYWATLGPFAAPLLSISVILFAFATVLCWAHYGAEAVAYLSPKPSLSSAFRVVYSLSVCLGALAASDWVWELADFCVGLMTLINLTALLLLRREVRRETEIWLEEDRARF